MARSEKRARSVSDEEFKAMDEKIGEHFDRGRGLLEARLDDE